MISNFQTGLCPPLAMHPAHYFYINEAVHSIVQSGNANTAVKELGEVKNRGFSIVLPDDASPEDKLYRLTQSTKHQKSIFDNVLVCPGALEVLQKISTLPITKKKVQNPCFQIIFDFGEPVALDITRCFNQMRAAQACYCHFSVLEEPNDILTRYMDMLQPLLHFIVGGYLTFGAIEAQNAYKSFDDTKLIDNMRNWYEIVCLIFNLSEGALEWMQNQADTQNKSREPSSKNSLTLLSSEEKIKLVALLKTIDLKLSVFAKDFYYRKGPLAPTIYTRTKAIIENQTRPLLKILGSEQT